MIDNSVCEHGGLRRKCEICDLRSGLAEARELLKEAATTIGGVAEQQAMPDDSYKPSLARIDAFLAKEKK